MTRSTCPPAAQVNAYARPVSTSAYAVTFSGTPPLITRSIRPHLRRTRIRTGSRARSSVACATTARRRRASGAYHGGAVGMLRREGIIEVAENAAAGQQELPCLGSVNAVVTAAESCLIVAECRFQAGIERDHVGRRRIVKIKERDGRIGVLDFRPAVGDFCAIMCSGRPSLVSVSTITLAIRLCQSSVTPPK